MEMYKELVLNKNEFIKYWINDEGVKIIKQSRELEEYFVLEIFPNNQFSFIYQKYVEFSNVRKILKIKKSFIKNPLANEYTYENVRDYLANKNKTNKEKINYVDNLLKDYFEHYNDEKSWYVVNI